MTARARRSGRLFWEKVFTAAIKVSASAFEFPPIEPGIKRASVNCACLADEALLEWMRRFNVAPDDKAESE